MFEILKTDIKSDTKNMMTFGLGGCTAIIMVFFTKDTQTPCRIIFGHHPLKNEIVQWYKSNYDLNFNIVTIIKSPGSYEKKSESKYFTLVINNKEYWENNINESNNKLILEPYENISTLYLKIYPKLEYTNNIGVNVSITPNI